MSPSYSVSPDLYDRMYAPFHADIPIFIEEGRGAGGPVLEVCCGTGRLLVPMREAGVEVDGLDVDVRMLQGLRAKLEQRGLTAELHCADMRAFSLPRRYALVFIAFNGFGHNLTQDDQLRALRACRAHLTPGGRFVIAQFHPSAQKLASFDGTRRLHMEHTMAEGERIRVWDASVSDRVEQVNHSQRTFERRDRDDRIVESADYTLDMRYVWKPEMELLLRLAGFTRWTVESRMGGYQDAAYNAPREAEDGGVLHWRAWCE